MAYSESSLTLSIGAVSRATGIPANTLRTWERRYGFPKPLRTEGGQRAYASETVSHLLLVNEALDQGLRPRDALTASLTELREWTQSETPVEETPVSRMLEACRALNTSQLRRQLRLAWASRGGVAAIDEVFGPFLTELGRLWHEGELEVYQEHFATEVLKSFLSEQWRTLADSSEGPVVVCASPPGEIHDLGLQFAACTFVLADRRVRYLGANTPVADILAATRQGPTEALAMSVSAFHDDTRAREDFLQILDGLPSGVDFIAGGAGAPDLPGITRFTTCEELSRWVRA